MFCQEDDDVKTCKVTTFNMSNGILWRAKYIHKMFVRVAGHPDLMSPDGCYHPNCLKSFYLEADKAEKDSQHSGLALIWLLQELRSHAAQSHILDLVDVLDRYIVFANEIDVQVPS